LAKRVSYKTSNREVLSTLLFASSLFCPNILLSTPREVTETIYEHVNGFCGFEGSLME
jgi:hypothetical protein